MSVINDGVQFDNICRTCLSEEPNMKSLFDTDSTLGASLQLFEMLIACTSVQVQKYDGLPAQMCFSCINYMARSFTFRKLCEESDATLRNALEEANKTDSEPLLERKPSCSAEELADIDRDVLNIKMKFEEDETNISDLMSDTQYDDFESQTIPSTNNDCDTKPVRIQKELMHDKTDLETNTLVIANENGISPDDSQQPIHPCEHTKSQCDKVIANTDPHPLTNEIQAHDCTRPHVCSECGRRFTRAHDMKRHLMRHAKAEPLVCKLCEQTFEKLAALHDHMRVHAHKNNFICAKCGRMFATRNNLVVHQKLHAVVKSGACNLCGKKYNGQLPKGSASTPRHSKKYTKGLKKYACSDCDKRFTSSTNLISHQRTHTGEKPFICYVCNKGFVDKKPLIVHIRVHSGEKPFVCHVCDKAFVSSSNRWRHMRIHTGEKPFQCHMCPKAFSNSNNLKNHVQRHIGERTHFCEYCNKGFLLAYELKEHVRIHTGEKPYKCKICHKSFAQAGSLSQHLKSH